MKKVAIAVVGVTALMALPAFAGINPLDPGLPQGWTSTVYTGVAIGDTAAGALPATKLSVVDSYSSALCVECHKRNPSDKISDPSGAFLAPGSASAHLGSHFVVGAGAALAGHSGGGFAAGFTGAFRNGGEYEKVDLWGVANQATKGLSKYGANNTTFVNNDIAVGAVVSAAGNIVCESCHNILVNRGDQLLLGGYVNGSATSTVNTETLAADQICVACHGAATSEDYAGFHANGNMDNFDSTRLKRHHVLTGDQITAANWAAPGTNNSAMWAPSFSYQLGTGKYNTWVKDTDLAEGNPFAFRNKVNVSGAGTFAHAVVTADAIAGLETGDIPTTTQFMCVSCHRPHNAETNAGAFILRDGVTETPTNATFAGSALAVFTGAANIDKGIMRQFNVDPSFTSKVYGEYVPLCKGCHQGYGN